MYEDLIHMECQLLNLNRSYSHLEKAGVLERLGHRVNKAIVAGGGSSENFSCGR